jgi:hypothetical protein
MAIYSDGYQNFYVSMRVVEDHYDAGSFYYSIIISSPNGKTVMTIASEKAFPSAETAKTFGLDCARAWIDKHNGR